MRHKFQAGSFLNQAHAGQRPVCTWFLEIAFCLQMSVCVCVYVSVCVSIPKGINNQWCDIV